MLYPSDSLALIEMLDALNNKQRLIILDRYCTYCGSVKLENEIGESECLECTGLGDPVPV